MSGMMQAYHTHFKRSNDFKVKFQTVFGLDIRKFYGTSILTISLGFDIVEFNQAVGCPDDVSLIEFVRIKYGEEGVKIIKALIA